MSTTPGTTQKYHPMMIIAAIAVILFCAVGIAAMMGWLPSSIGGNSPPASQIDRKEAVAAQEMLDKRNAQGQGQDKEQNQRAPERDQAPAQAAVCSNCGVVQSVRVINTRAEGSGVGAAGGAVVGGLLGNQVGGGNGRQLATIAGAIGGAVAGNQIEGNVNARRSYDITVQLDNGSSRTIHQSTQPRWSAGDQVRIVDGQIRAN